MASTPPCVSLCFPLSPPPPKQGQSRVLCSRAVADSMLQSIRRRCSTTSSAVPQRRASSGIPESCFATGSGLASREVVYRLLQTSDVISGHMVCPRHTILVRGKVHILVRARHVTAAPESDGLVDVNATVANVLVPKRRWRKRRHIVTIVCEALGKDLAVWDVCVALSPH